MSAKKKANGSSKAKTTTTTASKGKPTNAPISGTAKKKQISSSGGVPLSVCVVIGLLSLICGILSPPLLKVWREGPPTCDSAPEALNQRVTKKTEEKPKKVKMDPRLLMPPQEYPCTPEALASVLHQDPVPGMHVVCLNQTMRSLTVTMYRNGQKSDQPIVQEMEGLPEWIALKTVLKEFLSLSQMDNLRQPWAIFSPDGELLTREDYEDMNMAGFVQMGMVLVFQGGQFIWPGVHIGYRRTIDLYKLIPGGSPNLDTTNRYRTATLETISLRPLVFAVDGFLDENECDFFQQEATPTLAYSDVTLMDMDKGRPASDFRTSQSTFLRNNQHEMIRDIDYRTASLVRIPRFHQENVQVLRYGGGEKYDAHHDYFDKNLYKNDENTLKNFIQYGRRNRMITVFWYLSDVEEGGETVFPRYNGGPPPRSMSDCDYGLKVKPARGKVIIFYSLKADGSLDPLSLHGACPVKKGVKWAANKWVWNLPIEFGSGN